jgi:hypothetical protein
MPTRKTSTTKKRQSKKQAEPAQRSRMTTTVYVISPESGRLIAKNKKTYNDLVAQGVIKPGTVKEYQIKKTGNKTWEQLKPKTRSQRLEMYKKHPEMFMLPPRSDLADKSLNQDNRPKYPIATYEHPDKVNCQGVKAALARVHMEHLSRTNPKRRAYIVQNITKALNQNCRA